MSITKNWLNKYMKILGIDTSTDFLCIGLTCGSKLYEYRLEAARKMSVLITAHIRRILQTLDLHTQDIDFFACGLGPGSFTGLRVGVATIKGLSYTNKKPIAAVSTLDILANEVKSSSGTIIPALDAKRGLIYCCVYESNGKTIKKTSPYMLLSLPEFLKKVKPGSIILGDAIKLYENEFLKSSLRLSLLEKDYWYPKGHNIIKLAQNQITKGKLADSFTIEPIYLYPKECQIRPHKK